MKKQLTKLTQLGTALIVLSSLVLGGAHASAATPGQVDMGLTIANLTKGTGYATTQSADACNELEYRVLLYNPGPSDVSDVKIEASINTVTPYTTATPTVTTYEPSANPNESAAQATINFSTAQTQSYVAGSTQLLNSAGTVIASSSNGGSLADTITMGGGGIDIGALGGSVTEFVQFKTKVSCPVIPPTPSYSCTVLGLTAEENRTVKISNFATAEANGATFANAVITWGDNSTALTSASPVGQSHQYAANGTYTVTATAHFNVNGHDETAGSPSCTQNVTFSSTAPPVVTPPATTPPVTPPATPTALVNTGPGSVVALFSAAAIGGTAFYRRLLARRLSRQ